jgi:hypothetical protein
LRTVQDERGRRGKRATFKLEVRIGQDSVRRSEGPWSYKCEVNKTGAFAKLAADDMMNTPTIERCSPSL